MVVVFEAARWQSAGGASTISVGATNGGGPQREQPAAVVQPPRPLLADPVQAAGHAPAIAPAPIAAPSAPICPSRARPPDLKQPEIWARGIAAGPAVDALAAAVGQRTRVELRKLCGRCLYRTLTSYVRMHDMGAMTVVLTGDIPAQWTRDSAVQMGPYLSRVGKRPALRRVVEGALKSQAFFMLQDPWANAYNPEYKPPRSLPKLERQLGRGGWVWNRNFEVDSIGYFFNLLYNYYATTDVWGPELLLSDPMIHDAVKLCLRVLEIEQRHKERSPYRYSEMPNNGMGKEHADYTGMIWSGFRPADDPPVYAYAIPANIYVAGGLQRVLQLNREIWCDPDITQHAAKLLDDIAGGIRKYGVVPAPDDPSVKIYAYEVDGLGAALTDFDDPNVPSLLAIPLLGWDGYDADVYAATRARILSPKNKYFFSGSKLSGLGSPHTYPRYIWPLATAVEALTTNDASRQAELLKSMLLTATGNGLMHESVNVDNPSQFSRAEFGWANAMLVVAVEQLLGADCDDAAEEHRLAEVTVREDREPRKPANKGPDSPLYYETLEANVQYVG